MAADALSDVLRTVRLTGAVFFELAATEPWVAESAPREIILPKVLPGHMVSDVVAILGSFDFVMGDVENGHRKLNRKRVDAPVRTDTSFDQHLS